LAFGCFPTSAACLLLLWGLLAGALALWARHWRAAVEREQALRVVHIGRNRTLVGCAFASFGALLGRWREVRPCYIGLALLVGIVGGIVSAGAETRGHEAHLRAAGQLASKRDPAARLRRIPEWLLLPLIVLVLALLQLWPLRKLILGAWAPVGLETLSGLVAGSGAKVWLWARRKEREGSGPLVIPLVRD
jgi:hypothetical protein